METLSIKCPHCKQQFGIRNNSDKDKLQIKCPHCNNDISVVLRKKPIQMAGSVPDDTDSGETMTGMDMMKGDPVIIFNGVDYPLQIGRNTIGRGGSSSMATIKLPSEDRYMSRTNAIINVKKLPNGTHYVTASSINERNLVQVNGRPINMGDRTVLQNGYILTLGNTKVVFSLKQ